MIQKGRVPSVSIRRYGKQVIEHLDVPNLDGREQAEIPVSVEFNSSWKIEHACLSCGNTVEIDQNYEENNSSYLVLKNIHSLNYSDDFLGELATLFDSIERVTIEEVSYLNRSDFQYNFDFQRKSSTDVTHHTCQHCQADYLGLIRVGLPQPAERGLELGRSGKVEVAEIVYVETKNGFDEYEKSHRKNQ